MHLVQLFHRIKRVPLQFFVDAVRVRQVQDRIAAGAELHALVDSGKKSAAPAAIAAARTFRARTENDERREILRFRAQPIENPGAHARTSELHAARVHQQLARSVVERVRGHRFHQRDVVDDLRSVRQKLRKLSPALAGFVKLEFRSEQLRIRIDERGSVALQQFGWRKCSVELRQAAACCRRDPGGWGLRP